MVANVGIVVERLPFWILVVAAVASARWPGLSLALFLTAYGWRTMGGGAMGPAWQDMIARVIPLDRRGRFWGLSSSLGVGCGVAGSLLSAWLLRTLPFPDSFVALFAMAASLVTISWFFLAQTREPPQRVTAPRRSQRQFWPACRGWCARIGPFAAF